MDRARRPILTYLTYLVVTLSFFSSLPLSAHGLPQESTQDPLTSQNDQSCPEEPGRCRKGDCFSSNPGTLATWQDPPLPGLGTPSSLDSPVRASNASVCCDWCRSQRPCLFWQHVSDDPSTPFSGGYCYLLAQDKAPACAPSFQTSARKSVVGGPCNPEVTDDPHFTDGYGVTFDFSGDELNQVFCLVTDANLHVNVLLDGYWDKRGVREGRGELRTWIKEVGILWRSGSSDHSLHLVARKGPELSRGQFGYLSEATLDGQPIELPLRGEFLKKREISSIRGSSLLEDEPKREYETFMSFRDQGVVKRGPYEVERYLLDLFGIGQISLQLRPAHELLRSPDSAHVHFNIGFRNLQASPSIHGLLGQTFQPGRENRARKFSLISHKDGQFPKATFSSLQKSDSKSESALLDGSPDDYRASRLLRSDCQRSLFVQAGSSD